MQPEADPQRARPSRGPRDSELTRHSRKIPTAVLTGSPRPGSPRLDVGDTGDKFQRKTFAQMKRGSIDDNYQLLEELGAGSFGSVSRAKDNRNDLFFAIKTIPKRKVKDPQKIKEEFNVIRQLDHPHICKAYECYDDSKNIYLVMELLTGGTLMSTLCKQDRFTEHDAILIMRQILSALAYLHEASLIFRDLKTENVVFCNKQTGKHDIGRRDVKLIDFGLCCPIEKGAKMHRAAGTPYTVAPELVTSPVQYDQQCDSWSAGVVMYILLCGKYPFNGKTKDELSQKIRKEPCSFSQPAWKRVSRDGKDLVNELLRKQAGKRLTVGEALQHAWFLRETSLEPDEDLMGDVVESFKHFQQLNTFEKAAVTALAWRASDAETAQLREIFEALDRDGNGHVTVSELRAGIEHAGIEFPPNLQEVIVEADTDGGGAIEYTEFLAACLDKQKFIREEVVWEAFRIFDQDGSGTISKKELLNILTGKSGDRIRQAHGSKAVDNLLGEYDASGDDVIDFEEFMDMLNNVKDSWKHQLAASPRSRTSVRGQRRLTAKSANGKDDSKNGITLKDSLCSFEGMGRLVAFVASRRVACCCTHMEQAVPQSVTVQTASPVEVGSSGQPEPPAAAVPATGSPRIGAAGAQGRKSGSPRPGSPRPGGKSGGVSPRSPRGSQRRSTGQRQSLSPRTGDRARRVTASLQKQEPQSLQS